MAKPQQKIFTLLGGLQATNASAAAQLLAKIRYVDLHFAPKREQLIAELPGCKSESHLSEALSGTKSFPLRWLPTYIRYDREQVIVGELARWTSSRLVPIKPRTLTEKMKRLELVLEGMGDIGSMIREKAEELPGHLFEEEDA